VGVGVVVVAVVCGNASAPTPGERMFGDVRAVVMMWIRRSRSIAPELIVKCRHN
jgi:hypothetical protein